MFTKVTPKADSQLSNEDVANLIVGDALEKISQLTGLSQKKSFALLVNQVNYERAQQIQAPLLEQSEFQFISSLFS